MKLMRGSSAARRRAPVRAVRLFARRGAALFEVVIALSLLLVAMSAIGVAFRNGLFHVEHAERMNQATLMTDRLLTALDLGLIAPSEKETTGYFENETIRGMAWQMEAQPIEEISGLFHIRVSIFMGDPEGADNEKQHLLTTYVLRAEPRSINLETDFGIPEEQLTMLTDAIPGGAAVLDPANFNPRDVAGLPLDTLREMLPMILQTLGITLNPGQMEDVMQALQKGDMREIQNLAEQAGGGQLPGNPLAPKDQPPPNQPPGGGRQR